jgi:hypothetical protein
VLNRYIFAVPDQVPRGSPRFGSFFGIPYDDQYVNELWPLSVDAAGKLELTGTFAGYYGAGYLALEEFDYFRDTFGARK